MKKEELKRIKDLKYELIVMKRKLQEEMNHQATVLLLMKDFEYYELQSQKISHEIELIDKIINLIQVKYLN